jgi:hypothetical protein
MAILKDEELATARAVGVMVLLHGIGQNLGPTFAASARELVVKDALIIVDEVFKQTGLTS